MYKISPQKPFRILGLSFPKKVISALTRKNDYHHWIVHIQISLNIIFLDQICPNWDKKKLFIVNNLRILTFSTYHGFREIEGILMFLLL